ncbi:MAG: thiamine diphosphokinase [Chloroflexi bacterium]|nr:thiamine diphosphokinase [Chloroflexota bacterium]
MTAALVFANGELRTGPTVHRWLNLIDRPLVLAADGGAHIAAAYELRPDAIIGDMDSVAPALLSELEGQGMQIIRHPPEKDETDLELALKEAAARDCDPIIIIGGTGGRLDQSLANVYLLALPELAGRTVRMVAGYEEVLLLRPGSHTLHGNPGDTVSLLPVGGPAYGVRTSGLAYPLRSETLEFGPARGISNEMLADSAHISLEHGWLLVIHTDGKA